MTLRILGIGPYLVNRPPERKYLGTDNNQLLSPKSTPSGRVTPQVILRELYAKGVTLLELHTRKVFFEPKNNPGIVIGVC